MMKKNLLFLFLLSLPLISLAQTVSDTVSTYDVYGLSFRAKQKIKDPYLSVPAGRGTGLLKLRFMLVSGNAAGQEYVAEGFWAGEDTWKVNFSPDKPGLWEYEILEGRSLFEARDGKFYVKSRTESEIAENPCWRGPIRVRKEGKAAGHIFEYNDGTPFLWIGDTWWNWTKTSISPESFKALVDDRADKGFTIGQLFVPGNGWGRESSMLDRTYSIPDTEHLNRLEEMIAYANSRGITVWIHGWWARENMNSNIGEEKIYRWYRYLIDRFSAYQVIWVLAGEYNMHNYGGFPLEFWKGLGEWIKEYDPYKHPLSAHNTPPFWDGGSEAPQWSTGSVLHREAWLDYNQSQVGHGKYANEMIPFVISHDRALVPAKPVVVTEPWYEFVEGNPDGRDIRFGAWSSILSGSAGHSYGGGHVWLAHLPESPAGKGGPWPLEYSFDRNTLDYEGARSMGYLSRYFARVNWWELEPAPSLVLDYPQPFCLADPGREYIIYLRYGGSFVVNISDTDGESAYEYQWFNPATGEYLPAGIKNASNILKFDCPGAYPSETNYSDWVIHIQRKDN